MQDIFIFQRFEKKYRINEQMQQKLLSLIADRLCADTHGKSTVCSIYLDTPDHLLIRNSIDAKAYKEKLRLRSYGTPAIDTRVFFEIKKKLNGIVYKRRISLPLCDAELYIQSGKKPFDSQIMREIHYAMELYKFPKPSMMIAYEREAYFGKAERDLRITFDSAIRYRDTDLLLEKGTAGTQILPAGEMIMEIKTGGAMPLWLSHALNALCIYPSSFSKYGTAYRQTLSANKGELKNVCNF